MKTLHLTVITIVGIASLVLLGSYIITNPIINRYSGQHYTGEENRPYSYVIHEPYQGADKDVGTVTIQNQTFHVSTVSSTFQNWTKPFWYDIYGVNFTFLNGYNPVNSHNGKIYWVRITFPDDTTDIFNANITKASGQPQYNFTTVLSNHTNPQAGFTVYDGKILLLVNWPKIHSNLNIMGLNDTYRPRQPIDFQINVNGFDYFDAAATPDINITRTDGTIVWKKPQYLVMCCVPELADYDKTFNLVSLGGPVILNETGSYIVEARYNSQTVEKEFTVSNSVGNLITPSPESSNNSTTNHIGAIELRSCNPEKLSDEMRQKSYSANEQKAISLAEVQPEVISKTIFFGYHYDGISDTWSWDKNCTLTLTSVDVVFQSNNHDMGPLVVTEDPTLEKIIKIETQPAIYMGGPRQ